jgi:Putative peptidoglycan binding domain
MSETRLAAVLGLDPAVVEEVWNTEEGPYDEEIRVMQRALLIVGFPTGHRGQPWIDGLLGPATRRALKMWQGETGREVTGKFDSATRAALIAAVGEVLAGREEMHQIMTRGQLDHVQGMQPITGKLAVKYYGNDALALVGPELAPVLLGLYAKFNNGTTLPGLALTEYLRRTAAGESPAQARRLASRYGFLQLPGAFLAEHPKLDLDRAANPGDIAYHLEIIAIMLTDDKALHKAATKLDAARMEQALAVNTVACVLPGPQPLGEAIAEAAATLARGLPPEDAETAE